MLALLGPTMQQCYELEPYSTMGKQRESLSQKLGMFSRCGMISPVNEYVGSLWQSFSLV